MAENDRASGRPDEPAIENDNVLDVEQLARKTGITGDQAQALVDRIGNDREAVEAAALVLAKSAPVLNQSDLA